MRCDLGPVDDPHDPPCVRCRRESKECFFSATRRKRKADGEEVEVGDEDNVVDDYAQRNGRKTSKTGVPAYNSEPVLQHARRSMTAGSLPATSPLDGYNLPSDGSYQQPSPYTTGEAMRNSEEGQDQEVANETAAALFQSRINIPGDALHLLLKASNQSEDLHRRDSISKTSTSQLNRQSIAMQGDYSSGGSNNMRYQGGLGHMPNIDPAISNDRSESGKTPIPKDVLSVWSRLRFVRAGWFTAREGISYIE